MRLHLSCAAGIAMLLHAGAVLGCGGPRDDEPPKGWTLDHRKYDRDSALPFLSPGNDSRINLQFLLFDIHPKPISQTDRAPTDDESYATPGVLFSKPEFDAVLKFNACPSPRRIENGEAAVATTFTKGEGDRCLSFESGKQAFVLALQADTGLAAEERRLLEDGRRRMSSVCVDNTADATSSRAPLVNVSGASSAAQDFATYLAGAEAFYRGDFDLAATSFGKLTMANNAWLRETARYMIARNMLNKAQVGAFANFETAGQPKLTDRVSLSAAESELNAYIAAYPVGRYVDSARGLVRRVYWLADDKERLAAEYGKQIARWSAREGNLGRSDLVEEIDAKYLAAFKIESHDPILLAVQDLMLMRTAHNEFTAADIEAQAPDFGGHEDLFVYLKAARAYYLDGDSGAALRLLGPGQPGPLSPPYLAFSRETLRGQALMATGDWQAAAAQWQGLLPRASQPWQKEAVELGLALTWERAGALNKVFLPETRLSSPRIAEILLRQSAGPILLRMAVADPQTPEQRRLARFVLLFKEATRGLYAGFLRDYSPDELVKDGAEENLVPRGTNPSKLLWKGQSEFYPCPDLKAVVTELAANPRSSHGLLCLGEFVRTNNLDFFETKRPAPDELGGAKPIFPGERYSRGEVYKSLIAAPATPDNDRAYALFRAINCYAPNGGNGCGGKDVVLAQRKAWFQTLKTNYGATSWAKSLKIYW